VKVFDPASTRVTLNIHVLTYTNIHIYEYTSTIGPDYVALETELVIARWVIIIYEIPNNNELRRTGKAGIENIEISCLGP
jgi:hypothetical protein